jgi:DNA integrity scanning protein DisA with diadenylate cyclase activity
MNLIHPEIDHNLNDDFTNRMTRYILEDALIINENNTELSDIEKYGMLLNRCIQNLKIIY